MAADERRRHQLYRRLEDVLGQDEAGTLLVGLMTAQVVAVAGLAFAAARSA